MGKLTKVDLHKLKNRGWSYIKDKQPPITKKDLISYKKIIAN